MKVSFLFAWVASAAFAVNAEENATGATIAKLLLHPMRPSPEAKLVLPHGAESLQSELDGVMSFSAPFQQGEEVTITPSSVEKMEKAVTDLVTNVDGATPMGDSVRQIKALIQKTMLPKVEKASNANQVELDRLASDVAKCSATKLNDEHVADKEKTKYLKASPLHKACRTREATLATEARGCKRSIRSTKQIRDLKCNAMEQFERNWGQQSKNSQIVEKGGGETPKIYMKRLHDTYCGAAGMSFFDKFVDLEDGCEKERKRYQRLEDGCKQKKIDYKAKIAECNNIQAQMDGAACNRAVLIKDSCESYAECFNSRRVAFQRSKKIIKDAEKDRKAEWRALKRMVCLIDSFRDGKVQKDEISDCKGRTHDTSHLSLIYPQLKSPIACVVPNRYPATAAYKKAEFAPLPALAKGQVDANECYGVLEISTKPKAGSPLSCKCERVTLNGPFSPGALVKCMECRDVSRSDDKDSCPEGTKIFSPRSRADWRTFLASAGPLRDPDWIIDITRPSGDCGGCTKSPMNSDERGQSGWMTRDGSPWWLRSTSFKEPNGDYSANCYLGLGRNIIGEDDVSFNDGGCNTHSRSYYCQQKMVSTKPKSGSPKGCNCERVELTGRYSPGVLLKCVGCIRVRRSTDKDSCPEGTKLFSPRSREDWRTIIDSVGSLRSPNWIVDVTQPRNGCAGCTGSPMNFESPEQATWRTQDGSPWWLRSTRYSEPNGDYKANCYMDLWHNPNNADSVTFNDGNCNYNSNSYYCQPRQTK